MAGPGESTSILSEVDRQRNITDEDIMDVAKKASSEWKSIARRLPNALRPGELAFELGTSTLKKIEKDYLDEEERLIQSFVKWRAMSPQHNWGLLWDTLQQCGHGRVAAEVRVSNLLFAESQTTSFLGDTDTNFVNELRAVCDAWLQLFRYRTDLAEERGKDPLGIKRAKRLCHDLCGVCR